MQKFSIRYVLILFLAVFLSSCQKEEEKKEPEVNKKKEIMDSYVDLIERQKEHMKNKNNECPNNNCDKKQ